MRNEDLKLKNAIHYSCAVVGQWTKDGSVRIPELSEEFRKSRAIFQPMYLRVGSTEAEFRGFQIADDATAFQLLSVYETDPDAAMLIRNNLRVNVFLGTPMPSIVRLLASRIMDGDLGCAPKGRPPELDRNTLLRGLVSRIREKWGFDLAYDSKNVTYSPTVWPPRCGSEIVSACLREYGVDLESETAANLVYNNKHLQDIADQNSHIFLGNDPQVGLIAALLGGGCRGDDEPVRNVFRYFALSPEKVQLKMDTRG